MDKNIITKEFKVDGMTCSGCETRIENVLKKLSGVKDIQVKFSASIVKVSYIEELINEQEIIKTIENLGYIVIVEDGKEKQKTDKSNNIHFIGIILIIAVIYLIIKNTVGFNFIPQVSQSTGYIMLFTIGLLTSLHCIAMCSGINISQCSSYRKQVGDTKYSKLIPSLLYNAGRVISYTLIGGIVGALGSIFSLSGPAKGLIAILSGIFMLIMGLNMLNVFPWLKKINPRMPKIFGKKIRASRQRRGPLYVGLLNGLMPCGPLQAMQIYALGTGSFIAGATAMLFFSLGTVPLMFGIGALSSLLSEKFNHKMIKISAILVIILGMIMLNRGFNLSGIVITPNIASTSSINVAVLKDNVQIVTTELTGGQYTPITVQKGIPVKWTIKVKQGDLNGCNNPLTINKFNITKKLVVGDNLIEFTPNQEGDIVYTCWMGMISSKINVIKSLADLSSSDIIEAEKGADNNLQTTAGCCGAR